MQLREAAVGTWKVVEKVTIPLSLAVMAWALLNLIGLNDRVTKIEADAKADEAQWRILQVHTEQIRQQSIEVEVYKRMFEMLLSKDKLTIERVTLPDLPKTAPKTIEDYRREQMQVQERVK